MRIKNIVYSFAVALLLLMLLVTLTGCTSVTSVDYKEIIPDDVKNYTYNGEERTCTVEEVNVTKEDTEDDYKTVFCDVKLKDDTITRLAHLEMTLRHYDTGGWQVESFDPTDDEEILEWSEEKAKSLAENALREKGYNVTLASSSIDDYDMESDGSYRIKYSTDNLEGSELTYSPDGKQKLGTFNYTIDEKFDLVDISGTLTCFTLLGYEYDNGYYDNSSQYPVQYFDKIGWDFSQVSEKWHFDGKWQASVPDMGGYNPYDVTLNFSDSSSGTVKWDGIAAYMGDNGVPGQYTDSGTLDITKESLLHREVSTTYKGVVFQVLNYKESTNSVSLFIGYPGFGLELSTDGIKIERDEKLYNMTRVN